MRTTLALDDELIAKAQAFPGLREKSALVREALKALIERESAKRLARLGGSEPELELPPRRRLRSKSLLSHRNTNKGGLVRPVSGTMELPETIDPQRRTKPWDIIAQCSASS